MRPTLMTAEQHERDHEKLFRDESQISILSTTKAGRPSVGALDAALTSQTRRRPMAEGNVSRPAIPAGLCQCGCGGRTKLTTQTRTERGLRSGDYMQFIKGHRYRGEQHPAFGGMVITGPSGYRYLYAPEHPRADGNGRVLEHIVVVERALGHYLDRRHEVHHFDENKANNAPTNLVACEDSGYHKLLHRRQRALEATGNPNALVCVFCGEYDDPANMAVQDRRRPKSGESYGTPRSFHRECQREYAKTLHAKKRGLAS